jgi:hypothetical protein
MANEAAITFNREWSIELHNEIFEMASDSTETWWEVFSGPEPSAPRFEMLRVQPNISYQEALVQLERRLPEGLVRFLKGTKYCKNPNFHFFHNVWLRPSPGYARLY